MRSLVCSSVRAEDHVSEARKCVHWVGTQSGSTYVASTIVAGADFAGLPGSKIAAVQAEAMHGGPGKSGSPHPQEVGAFACQVSSRPDFVQIVFSVFQSARICAVDAQQYARHGRDSQAVH